MKPVTTVACCQADVVEAPVDADGGGRASGVDGGAILGGEH